MGVVGRGVVIRIDVRKGTDGPMLSVRDNGGGMDAGGLLRMMSFGNSNGCRRSALADMVTPVLSLAASPSPLVAPPFTLTVGCPGPVTSPQPSPKLSSSSSP